MPILRKIAEKVAAHNARIERAAAIDPATILIIIEVVTMAIKAIQECKNTPENAEKRLHTPAASDKFFVAKAIKKASKDKLSTIQVIRLRRSFFDECKKLESQEIQEAFKEVPANTII